MGVGKQLQCRSLKEYWDAVAKLDDILTHHGIKHDHEALVVRKCLRWKVS